MSNKVFVGLGSNKSDRIEYIKNALKSISKNEFSSVEKVSSIYESLPYGVKEQKNFYNAVALIKTELSLKEFFIFCKEIEIRIGRTKSIKWGPREIDIDILFFNDIIYSDEEITIPHKEILLRDFVFVPLIEVDPDFKHPILKEKMKNINFIGAQKNIIKKLVL